MFLLKSIPSSLDGQNHDFSSNAPSKKPKILKIRLKTKKWWVIDAQMSPLELILALSSCAFVDTKNVTLYTPLLMTCIYNKAW